MGVLELFRRMRTNGVTVWPRSAYEEEITNRRFLGRTSFVLNAPDAIRHVLVDNHENYSRTNATIRILQPLLGRGLFLSEGRDWRLQRRTLAPAFTPKAVSLLIPHMCSALQAMLGELDCKSAEPVDLFTTMQHLALEIAGRSMFSLEMKQHGRELREFVLQYSGVLSQPHMLDVLLPTQIPTPWDIGRRWFSRHWMQFVSRLIDERINAGRRKETPRDLFDLLASAQDPMTEQTFSQAELRDQVATMLLAGHETTAVALSWSLYLLAISPHDQEKVAQETRGIDLTRNVEIDKLTYTRAVIEETLRLYPPAYVIVRTAKGRDHFSGTSVRRGDLVVVSPWLLHRHRTRWADPDSFNPERFLPGAASIDRYSYLPFGLGPRVCIGAHFALTEATLALASLMQKFRIALLDSQPVLPVAIVTTQPNRQPPFRLQPRR
jgi:cytochrome P450